MKKTLRILLAIMNWLTPFVSVTTMITLPTQAAKVPLGSLVFWFYLAVALAGIWSLIFMILGWVQIDWLLQCYETLTSHVVFRDQRLLAIRPRILMVLAGSVVNALAEDGLVINGVTLQLVEFVVIPAAVINLVCLIAASGFYLYLKLYVSQHKETYVTYEWAILRSDGTERYYQDVCQVCQLEEEMKLHRMTSLLCKLFFKPQQADHATDEDSTSRH